MSRVRIAVLASGNGSNLQALIDHFAALGSARPGDIVLVASDQPSARALVRASDAGIATAQLATRAVPGGEHLASLLERNRIDLLVLAGYLRLVPPEVTKHYVGRIVNVHPGPLPEFGGSGMYGARVHRAVLEARRPQSGPTVHFVDEQFDHGAVIAHVPVPVLANDDAETLGRRVLAAEHSIFPRVVEAIAAGEISLAPDGSVTIPAGFPARSSSRTD